MIAILYATTKPQRQQPSMDHFKVCAYQGKYHSEQIWVRATLHKSGDVETALARAKPRKGEIVLNAIELDGGEK